MWLQNDWLHKMRVGQTGPNYSESSIRALKVTNQSQTRILDSRLMILGPLTITRHSAVRYGLHMVSHGEDSLQRTNWMFNPGRHLKRSTPHTYRRHTSGTFRWLPGSNTERKSGSRGGSWLSCDQRATCRRQPRTSAICLNGGGAVVNNKPIIRRLLGPK